MVTPTSHMTILVSKLVNEACGGNNMGIAVDYGHEQMYRRGAGFNALHCQKSRC